MRTKKIKEPKRNWENTAHYTSDLNNVKNLNEIYRFVYFKPKEYHFKTDAAEWVYIDISLDDLINSDSGICRAQNLISANYDFIARMRCTGVKDKFGNLIFEGDITECKFSSSTGEIGCTTYNPSSGDYYKGYSSISSYQKNTEIIGDIFQTPKLDWLYKKHLQEFGLRKPEIACN